MNRLRPTKGRRPIVNSRRLRFEERESDEFGGGFEAGNSPTGSLPMVRRPAVGWDQSGSPEPVGVSAKITGPFTADTRLKSGVIVSPRGACTMVVDGSAIQISRLVLLEPEAADSEVLLQPFSSISTAK